MKVEIEIKVMKSDLAVKADGVKVWFKEKGVLRSAEEWDLEEPSQLASELDKNLQVERCSICERAFVRGESYPPDGIETKWHGRLFPCENCSPGADTLSVPAAVRKIRQAIEK